jgi:hypothetical protein
MVVIFTLSKTVLTTKIVPRGHRCSLGTLLCLYFSQIGMIGFEPTPSASRKQRATKLRYIPMLEVSVTDRIISALECAILDWEIKIALKILSRSNFYKPAITIKVE